MDLNYLVACVGFCVLGDSRRCSVLFHSFAGDWPQVFMQTGRCSTAEPHPSPLRKIS